MEILCFWFLKFMYYAFIGYLIEIFFALIKDHKFINRGFLLGPYCSIYGVAGIVLAWFNPELNILINFVLAIICCGLIEGLTGFILDKIFKMRWWDYSNEPLNLNGYICIRFMLLFGLFSLIGIYFLNPLYEELYEIIGNPLCMILAGIILIFYLLDLVISNILIFKIKKTIDPKDAKNTTLIINTKKRMLLSIFR